MISVFRYIYATKRLTEVEKTIRMLGGEEAPVQILAQRDMIRKEIDYYVDQSIKFFILIFTLFLIVVPALFFFKGVLL